MPRSPVITDLFPEQSIQRRLAEAEENHRNSPRVSSGAPGTTGATGATGAEGRGPVGLRYKFSTSTTSTDPGSGLFRFNKNIISESPTQMYISETDADGAFAALYMVHWGVSTSTNKGYIIMRKRGQPATWALFSIQKQYTDNGTWDTFPELTKVAGEGTWNNGDEFYIDSIFVGDKGEKGETGASGAKGETGPEGPAGSAQVKAKVNAEGAIKNSQVREGITKFTVTKVEAGKYSVVITGTELEFAIPVVTAVNATAGLFARIESLTIGAKEVAFTVVTSVGTTPTSSEFTLVVS